MAESSDFDPGPWSGHNFSDARKAYDTHAGRSYSNAVSENIDKKALIPKSLTSQASIPLVIVSDVTGSMGTDPTVFFSKLGYLDLEMQNYLGKDAEICFCATGDAYSDKYPVQITNFTKGLALKDELKKLIIEGNGGGQQMETYELLALYCARKVKTPKAIRKPILIFIGDEAPYPEVDSDQARELLDIKLNETLTTKALFNELTKKWAVYWIRRPYGDYSYLDLKSMDRENHKIYGAWADLIGEDHIVSLPNADRVVDIIFGILGEETDKFEYFKDEVTSRQLKDADGKEKIAIVFKALGTIHTKAPADDEDLGRSVTRHTSSRGTRTPRKGEKLL